MPGHKIKMGKQKFRIGELARALNVKKFVVRFWEKKFGFESDRSQGGQRFYTVDDVEMFRHIKDLLYNQGFTIAGAKLQLKGSRPVKAAQRTQDSFDDATGLSPEVKQMLKQMRTKLVTLRELVDQA